MAVGLALGRQSGCSHPSEHKRIDRIADPPGTVGNRVGGIELAGAGTAGRDGGTNDQCSAKGAS